MKKEIRIILAFILLLVGLITAALFRPAAHSAPGEDGTEVAMLATPSHNRTVSYVSSSSITKTPVLTMPFPKRNSPKIVVPALPTPENILPMPASSQATRKKSALPASHTTQRDTVPELPVSFPTPKTPLQPESKKRVHTIVDGDTLRSLASRYLDNESRWSEIYQVNRRELEDPTSLPIGAKLTIPPRAPTLRHASKSRVFSASTERQASRLTQRPVSRQTLPPIARKVAKPIEKSLEVLPNEPMVPMTP